MSDKLEWALWLAARGLRVFPLQVDGKLPTVSAFPQVATTDPVVIRAWWQEPTTGQIRDNNIGVLTTGLVVADIDVKDNRPGLDTYNAFGGTFDTFTVYTPTGGYHCYFDGPSSSLSPLGPGLDIRSHNGYVVGPGSTIRGNPYVIANDAPLSWVPLGLEARLRPPGARPVRDNPDIEADSPSGIANATAWLELAAPIAIEGEGGDNQTYHVAATLVRDFALTEETAYELLSSSWNPRCIPPWEPDELWRKVENAYAYGTGSLGSALPALTFANVVVPEMPTVADFDHATFGNAVFSDDIPPRPWLIDRLLMRKAVTTLIADGGTGKSTLLLVIAAHLAIGRDIGRFKVRAPCKSILYNGEDDLYEQSRRLWAICSAYGFDFTEVRAQIHLMHKRPTPLALVVSAGRDAVSNEAHVSALIQAASDPAVGFVGLDPLVSLHTVDENDNTKMRLVMNVAERIAHEADVSLLLNHHTNKSGGSGSDRAGDVGIGRGAGDIIAASRIAFTLTPATDNDCQTFGIRDEERGRFVRLDDGKMNLTLKGTYSTWFFRQTVRMWNGDEVGSLTLQEMHGRKDEARLLLARICARALYASNTGVISIKQAVLAVKADEPTYARMSDDMVRDTLERALTQPIQLDSGTEIYVERHRQGNRDNITVRMR